MNSTFLFSYHLFCRFIHFQLILIWFHHNLSVELRKHKNCCFFFPVFTHDEIPFLWVFSNFFWVTVRARIEPSQLLNVQTTWLEGISYLLRPEPRRHPGVLLQCTSGVVIGGGAPLESHAGLSHLPPSTGFHVRASRWGPLSSVFALQVHCSWLLQADEDRWKINISTLITVHVFVKPL